MRWPEHYIPIGQMDKLRPREVRRLVQGHMAARAILMYAASAFPVPVLTPEVLSGANLPARGTAVLLLLWRSSEQGTNQQSKEKALLWDVMKL